MNVTATDPMIGTLLERRYRIRSRIAQGGMAAVYEALDERLERVVAVKVMHPPYATDPVFVSRFMREARAAAALNHPHIVAVFDQGHHDQIAYLVMEKVDGTTLRGILKQRKRLGPAEAFGVMEPMLAALAQAHERGIAHRDVKPENVLISPTGIVKVADFGLARAIESSHNLTNRNVLLGTVAYLAPEQIVAGESDARSDVYAAGIVLYELLTGAKPYTGTAAVDVAYKHVNNDVPAPSGVVANLPPAIDDLVAMATRRDRSTRLASAGAFLTAMRQLRQQLNLTPVLVTARMAQPATAGEATPLDPRPWESPSAQPPAGAPDWPGQAGPAQRIPPPPQPKTNTSVMPPLGMQQAGPASGNMRGAAAPTWNPPPPPPLPSGDTAAMSDADRKRRRVIAVVAGAVALLLIVGIGLWWFDKSNDVTVPRLVGLNKTAAQTATKDAGLKLRFGTAEFSDSVSEDVVLRQQPGAKNRLDSGDTVTVVLSRGPQNRPVPSVKGKTQAEAEAILKDEQFKPVVSEEESQVIPKGSAIATTPAEGEIVKADTEVQL
ncbi:MAG: Stk1 family PASTA domain-containing Ser/Thr kinase, partial [Pseudonocardiaceae bacterium]